MNLSMELGPGYTAQGLLSLAISAKNNMHHVRGYSTDSNQWAFGQGHPCLSSYLQQYRNLPLESARTQPTFEEGLRAEEKARKLFLQVDARRRISRALHTQNRPLRDFQPGELVYYFRRVRKEGSRWRGLWHGPARVPTHEKTTTFDDTQHAGSVIWLAHAGRIVRCSPGQLRRVTHDLRHLDRDINGPHDFHSMLEQVSQQQKYLDISQEDLTETDGPPEHERPHFRAYCKTDLAQLRRSSELDPSLAAQHGREHGFEDPLLEEGGRQERGGVSGIHKDDNRRVGGGDLDSWEETPRNNPQPSDPRRGIQQMGGITCESRPQERQGSRPLRILPPTTPPGRSTLRGGTGGLYDRKREPPTTIRKRAAS